jgi:hypothetical protein
MNILDSLACELLAQKSILVVVVIDILNVLVVVVTQQGEKEQLCDFIT